MTDVMPILNKELIDKIDEDEKTANANVDAETGIVLEKEVEPREQTDMFKDEDFEKKPKLKESERDISLVVKKVKKVKKKVDDILDVEDDEDKSKPKKKRTYPHLEKARAKALLNRQKRAEEKRIEKEKKAEEKKELKLEKARLRIEKKKENARNHYWEKKAEAVKNGEVKTKTKPIPITPNMSNYDNFASMMDRYNNEKLTQYKAQQKLKEAEDEKKTAEKRKKKLSNPLIHRPNIRGMYVTNSDYPTDLFF